MAARLIRHASRLLAAPVSFQPSIQSSIPSEGFRVCQLAPSLPCQAPLHTSSLCRLAESREVLQKVSENLQTAEDDVFVAMLDCLQGVEEVLDVFSRQKLDVNRCVLIIQQISKRKPDKTEYLSDPRFIELLDTVNRQIQSVWNSRLVQLMKSLHMLHLDSKNHYLKSVDIEVRWRLRRLSMRSLGQLANYVTSLPQSPESRSLLEDLTKQVDLRWTEITDTLTLSLLIGGLGLMPGTLMERLEDKVLEFADKFQPGECRRVLLALANQNRRSLPLLRALSHNLEQQKLEFPPGIMVDLAFSFARLNFCPVHLLTKLCTDIVSVMHKATTSDVSMFLRSVSKLRFSFPPLSEAVTQAFLDGSKEFTYQQLCNIILSFAKLNFVPSQSEEFFNKIHPLLLTNFNSLTWLQQIDLVWSLCILGHATAPYFQRILDPQFCKKIIDRDSKTTSSHEAKIMNINATAMLESPDHWGALLPDNLLQTLLNRNLGYGTTSLQKDVINALRMVFPDPEMCNLHVKTIYGWYLAADVILDSEYKPLPIKNFVAPHLPMSGGTEPVPEDARRFAVVIREFSHYFFRGKELLGPNMMSRRHLRAAGFLVLEVPFYEWLELKSDFQKQSYLQDQFRKVVAEDMAQ